MLVLDAAASRDFCDSVSYAVGGTEHVVQPQPSSPRQVCQPACRQAAAMNSPASGSSHPHSARRGVCDETDECRGGEVGAQEVLRAFASGGGGAELFAEASLGDAQPRADGERPGGQDDPYDAGLGVVLAEQGADGTRSRRTGRVGRS